MTDRPNSACWLDSGDELIDGTKGRACWFGLASTANKRVTFFDVTGSASVAGNTIATQAVAANGTSQMWGPFFPTCGLYIAEFTGASVSIWIDKR